MADALSERRGWDSNPRAPCDANSFRDCPAQPLRHPSGALTSGILASLILGGTAGGTKPNRKSENAGSAELESAAVEVASQELQRMTSGGMKRLRRRRRVDELRVRRLLLVGAGVSLPGRRQKEQRKAMGDVAVRVVDRVRRGLRQTAEGNEVE